MLRTTRLTGFIGLIGLSTALSLACGSSSGGGGAGGAAGTTGNNGGSASNNGGSASSNGGSSNNGGSTSNGGSNADCDPAADPTGMGDQCPALMECAEDNCGAEYEECMGAGYMDGDFAGSPCEMYMECVSACDCDDACLQDCEFGSECQSCFTNTVGGCIFANCLDEASSCQAGGSGGAGNGGAANSGGGTGGIPGLSDATCADLQACCDSLSADDQATCQSYYDQVSGFGDFGCAAVIAQFPTCG